MNKRQITITVPQINLRRIWPFVQKWLLPNPGTLILMIILALTIPVLARPNDAPSATSVSTIPYQGRLADAAGTPVTGMQNMEFRIYDVPTDGTPLWEEFWTGGNSVSVSDGLFSVLLGSLNTNLVSVVQGHEALYLGVTVGTDTEMAPRVQLGSVPFSMQALTVPDGSVTTAKIADGAVTQAKFDAGVSFVPPDGSITAVKLADDAVTAAKIADGAVGSSEVTDNSLTASDLAANSVASSEIANGSVDQAKAPSLLRGPGNNFRVETGTLSKYTAGTIGEDVPTVNFSNSFTTAPRVYLTNCTESDQLRWDQLIWSVKEATVTGFKAHYYIGTVSAGTYKACWMAIGN